MRGQVLGSFAIDKTGAVVCVEVSPGAPRQREIDPSREGVALVVIEKEVAYVRRLEISEAAGNSAGAFRVLIGIGGMELGASCEPRRVHRAFPSPDAGALDGEGKENVRIAQNVMVEKVLCAGAEVGEIERPSRHGDGQTKFVLLIALAPQWQKAKSLLRRLLQQRTVHGEERRRLVVTSVKAAEDPVEVGHADGGAN